MALYDADASRDRDLQVQDFFSDPERYRRRNVDLPIRPTIVRGLVGDCAGKSILDLGCGDGSLTLPLCGGASRLVLLDRSSAMLDTARRDTPVDCLGRVFYVEMDLTAYEPDETFDLVVCVGVLAHVRSIPRCHRSSCSPREPRGSVCHPTHRWKSASRALTPRREGGQPL